MDEVSSQLDEVTHARRNNVGACHDFRQGLSDRLSAGHCGLLLQPWSPGHTSVVRSLRHIAAGNVRLSSAQLARRVVRSPFSRALAPPKAPHFELHKLATQEGQLLLVVEQASQDLSGPVQSLWRYTTTRPFVHGRHHCCDDGVDISTM